MFTKRQVYNADLARDLYHKIGRPGEDAFENILWTNRIHNCPITVDDARQAVAIYGPDIPKLKGATTNGPPVVHVPDQNVMEVPRSILLHNSSYTCERFCLRKQDSFSEHDIKKYWLAHHSTSSKSTKRNHIERIKSPDNNIQKPRPTYQFHTWRQRVCMH